MGFTSHGGDPQWLRDQRAAQARYRPRPGTPGPLPFGAPRTTTVEADPHQFVQGAKNNSGWAFVLGAVAGAVIARGRR
jgi:hypothetical protein